MVWEEPTRLGQPGLHYICISMSDHTVFRFRIKQEESVQRVGSWCLNTALLLESAYCKGIRGLVGESVSCPMLSIDVRVWWDNFKYDIKCFSVVYAADMKR